MAGRRCTVCEHEHRESIDKALAVGSLSNRAIAGQFNLGRASIDRHQASHLTARIVKAAEKRIEKQADAFLDGIMDGISAAKLGVQTGMSKAAEIPAELAYRLAPGFLAQQARYLELLGQATGRLNQAHAPAGAISLVVVMPRAIEPGANQANHLGDVVDVQAIAEATPCDSVPES